MSIDVLFGVLKKILSKVKVFPLKQDAVPSILKLVVASVFVWHTAMLSCAVVVPLSSPPSSTTASSLLLIALTASFERSIEDELVTYEYYLTSPAKSMI